MFSLPEQFSTAATANFESQLALLNSLNSKALESLTKAIELNVSAAQASMAESTDAMQQLLSAKDPQEFFTLSAAKARPNAESALSYSRHLAAIASGMRSEFTQVAEAQIAEAQRKASALVEDIAKNAMPGSESAIEMLKSTFDSANAGFQQLAKSAKQAVETLEANLTDGASQLSHVEKKSSRHSSKN